MRSCGKLIVTCVYVSIYGVYIGIETLPIHAGSSIIVNPAMLEAESSRLWKLRLKAVATATI